MVVLFCSISVSPPISSSAPYATRTDYPVFVQDLANYRMKPDKNFRAYCSTSDSSYAHSINPQSYM